MAIDWVQRVDACRLVRAGEVWSFARNNEGAIADHWQRRSAENPNFFDGRVHVIGTEPEVREGSFNARLIEVSFSSFLYWKDTGFGDAATYDGFGSALIRARGGEVVLARQSPSNLNAGLVYMPGGFIDCRDVGEDGTVDIDGSIARELREETGMSFEDFERRPGYLVTRQGRQFSIAVELLSGLAAGDLVARLSDNIARQRHAELAGFVVIGSAAELENDDIVGFSRAAAGYVLAAD